jgi:putative ABC transport system ATP-binding protein
MPDNPAILINSLTYAWPRQPVLLDIGHFSLARGEAVMLAGPSGTGKSTLLGIVTGILSGAQGTCEILGQPMNRLSGAARDRLRADSIG